VPQCGSVRFIGPGPLAGDHPGQIERLLLLGAADFDGLDGAAGQAGIHGEGHVGRGHHFADSQPEHVRQTLAAVMRIADQSGPAAFDQSLIGILEAGRGGDLAVFQPAAFPVANLVQRLQDFLADLGRAFENGGDGFRRGLVENRPARRYSARS